MVILSHGELAKKYDFSSLRWIISGAGELLAASSIPLL